MYELRRVFSLSLSRSLTLSLSLSLPLGANCFDDSDRSTHLSPQTFHQPAALAGCLAFVFQKYTPVFFRFSASRLRAFDCTRHRHQDQGVVQSKRPKVRGDGLRRRFAASSQKAGCWDGGWKGDGKPCPERVLLSMSEKAYIIALRPYPGPV